MRLPFLVMAAGCVGMFITALVGYKVNGQEEVENVRGTDLLLLVLSGIVFFVGWLMAFGVCRRRAREKANQT